MNNEMNTLIYGSKSCAVIMNEKDDTRKLSNANIVSKALETILAILFFINREICQNKVNGK